MQDLGNMEVKQFNIHYWNSYSRQVIRGHLEAKGAEGEGL
jgi:hypothetical protein